MNEPKIRAAFVLDSQKRPLFSDDGHHVHYRVKLWLEDAPSDAHTVTYKLHDSYAEPLREVRQGPHYEEELTSYGDYVIKALVRCKKDFDVVSAGLLSALRETYVGNKNAEISSALEVLESQ